MTTVAPIGSEILVSTTNANNQFDPQITALANGDFAVTWRSFDSGSSDIRGRVFAADGTPVNGSDFAVSTTNANNQLNPQIVALANGGFAVTWYSGDNGSNDDIRGRVFTADGTPVNGSDFLVSTTNSNNQAVPQVTALANGGFAITWRSTDNGSNEDIRGRVFAADGTPVNGSDFVVSTTNANNQVNPQITALTNGGFAVTWYSLDNGSNYDIRGQVFAADGTPVDGSDLLMSTANALDQATPQITALANGGFAVTWRSSDNGSNSDIRGQVFAADGTPVDGSDFLVSTANVNDQSNPQITALANGGFAVTWSSFDSGSSDIRGRVFAADGTPVNGSDFLVSTTNAIDQVAPQIAALANGGFAMTWLSFDNGSNGDIRGRVFAADGTPVNGSDFLVSITNANDQSNPQITALANGDFAVTWHSFDNGSNYDIRAQVFNVNDAPTTAPVTLLAIAEDSGSRLITQTELLSNADDVDGDSLTATGLAIATGSGVLVDNGNQTWTYTPAANDDGDVSFSYQITDGTASVAASASLDITPVNDAPTQVINDVLVTAEGQAVFIDGAEDYLVFADVEQSSSEITFTIASGVSNGSLALAGFGTLGVGDVFTQQDLDDDRLIYTHDGSETTSDAFGFSVSDGHGGEVTDQVFNFTITAVNDPAVIAGDDSGDVTEDGMLTASGALTIADPDAGEAQFQAATGLGGAYGLLNISADGTWTYTLDSDHSDVQRLGAGDTLSDTVQVLSADGTAHDITISVHGSNDAPTTSPVTLAAIAEDSGGQLITWLELLANADDVDGDTDNDGAVIDNLSVVGLAIQSGGGSLVDNGDDTWTYTPAANDDAAVSFSYQITDGIASVAASATLDITPVNDAPTAPVDAHAGANNVAEGAVNGTAVGITAMATDIDGPSVIYSLGDDAGGRFAIDASSGVVTVADGALIDYETAPGHAYAITVVASDGSLSSSETFSIAVSDSNDTAPVITSGAAASVAENTSGTVYTATASDADTIGGPVTFAISGGADAARFTINAATGALAFVAAPDFEAPQDADTDNVYAVEITASDGTNTSVAMPVSVTVSNVAGNVVGTPGPDNLVGTVEDDLITGLASNDTLSGGLGNDTLVGGPGGDALDGGAGFDTASYAGAGAGVTANLSLGFGAGGDAEGDTYVSIEALIGSDFGDTLVGKEGVVNVLSAGAGDDFIYAEGIDTVDGGAGDDVLFGGQGAGLNINLATASIETVWGSIGADVMDGSTSTSNLVIVGQGLTGGANADTMLGGSGDDFIYYRAGDVISGGTGNDWAVATLSASGVSLDMLATGFENAWGSTSNDTITAAGSVTTAVLVGDAGNDTLTGGNAGDFLYGFGDSDTLTGGGGDDNLIGGAGTDLFAFGSGWGTDIVWDWQNGAETFNMQGSGAANFGELTVNQDYFGSGNALISFSGNRILVVGGANQIDAGDFLF